MAQCGVRIGWLIAGAMLVAAAGCSSDPLDSGTYQTLFSTASQNLTATTYECVTIDFNEMNLRPNDGTCSMSSMNPGAACGTNSNCPGGTCMDSASNDVLQNQPIVQIDSANAVQDTNFVTGPCLTCSLGNPFVFSPCATDGDCAPNQCTGGFCLLGGALPVPCATDADCPVNQCVDRTGSMPDAVLTEDPYIVENLVLNQLRVYDRETSFFRTCGIGSVVYDPPLGFEVGPGKSNSVRFVMDIAALEAALAVGCTEFVNQLPNILTVQD